MPLEDHSVDSGEEQQRREHPRTREMRLQRSEVEATPSDFLAIHVLRIEETPAAR